MENNTTSNDTFTLYDLRVEVSRCRGKMVCSHKIGDYFEVRGEELIFPDGLHFSMYALAALIPLLPAKQRETHKNDWMTTDMEVACPDPHCGAIFKITRIGKREFKHSDVTVVPLPNE
jgi:uncharacterized repeat protein (TIGR04076 family)